MIPNLNFYDVYGYLIPGLALTMLLWLPMGLIDKQWPAADWGSALVAVVIGYVVGHIVQALARNAWPSKTMKGRFPSDALLDPGQRPLSEVQKKRLGQRIKALSGFDMAIDQKLDGSDIKASTPADERAKRLDDIKKSKEQRQGGFYFCRDALLTSKVVSYAEQMQGMYALTNGLTAAFALAAAHLAGWALSGLGGAEFGTVAWIALAVGLAGAIGCALPLGLKLAQARILAAACLSKDSPEQTAARLTGASVMLALAGAGYILGLANVRHPDQRGQLATMACLCVFAALTCFAAYKSFTVNYALTVYRAFNLYEAPSEAAANASKPAADPTTAAPAAPVAAAKAPAGASEHQWAGAHGARNLLNKDRGRRV